MSLFKGNQQPDYPVYTVGIQIADSSNTVIGGGGLYIINQTLNTTDLSAALSGIKAWVNSHDWTVEYGTGAHVSSLQIELTAETQTDVTASY